MSVAVPITEVGVAESLPEPVERPVLSPDPELAWRPGPRRREQFPEERRPVWRLETQQFVLVLAAVLLVVVLVMAGMVIASVFHAATAASH